MLPKITWTFPRQYGVLPVECLNLTEETCFSKNILRAGVFSFRPGTRRLQSLASRGFRMEPTVGMGHTLTALKLQMTTMPHALVGRQRGLGNEATRRPELFQLFLRRFTQGPPAAPLIIRRVDNVVEHAAPFQISAFNVAGA